MNSISCQVSPPSSLRYSHEPSGLNHDEVAQAVPSGPKCTLRNSRSLVSMSEACQVAPASSEKYSPSAAPDCKVAVLTMARFGSTGEKATSVVTLSVSPLVVSQLH